MLSGRVSSTDEFAEPAAPVWNAVAPERIEMVAAPLGLQPNDYVIASWQNRPYGTLESANLQSVHDGNRLAVRLSWAKTRPDTGAGEGFSDAAALAFPVSGDPSLLEMGSPDDPVHFLQWMARSNTIRSVGATGIGSSMPAAPVNESAKAGWTGGNWHVVIIRDLAGPEGTAQLKAGTNTRIGLAIWDGGNEERAGIKAVSTDWTDLILTE